MECTFEASGGFEPALRARPRRGKACAQPNTLHGPVAASAMAGKTLFAPRAAPNSEPVKCSGASERVLQTAPI